jgi:hypothetical protein
MDDNDTVELSPEQELLLQIEKQQQILKVGANWFYWIASLSVVNSLILFFGGQWSFIVGLGITQVIDALATVVAEEAGAGAGAIRAAALALDVGVAGLVALFGWFANQRKAAAFVIGMALYGLDGLLFLLVQDWLSLGFHAFALFGLFGGLKALRSLRELEPQIPGAPIEPTG